MKVSDAWDILQINVIKRLSHLRNLVPSFKHYNSIRASEKGIHVPVYEYKFPSSVFPLYSLDKFKIQRKQNKRQSYNINSFTSLLQRCISCTSFNSIAKCTKDRKMY